MAILPIVFCFCCLLAMCHYAYESILLPSIRLRLRYRVFHLRDILRRLKADKSSVVDDEAFRYMEDALNISAVYLFKFSVHSFIDVQREFKKNPNLLKQVEHRQRIMEACQTAELQDIYRQLIRITLVALSSNSLIFFLSVLILLIPVWVVKVLSLKVLKDMASKALAIPEQESQRLAIACLS